MLPSMPIIDDFTDEKVAEVKAANPGKVLHVLDALPEHPEAIMVQTPSAAIFTIWQQKVAAKDPTAARMLVEACCVWPAPVTNGVPSPELRALLDAKPGLSLTWAAELQEIAGLVKGDHRRKV